MATYIDAVKAVYHCLPSQMFKNVNEEKLMHHTFKMAASREAPQVDLQTKMFVDYAKDRLQPGTIFSLPRTCLPAVAGFPDELAIVPVGEAPPLAFDPTKIVQDALVAAGLAAPADVKLGIQK